MKKVSKLRKYLLGDLEEKLSKLEGLNCENNDLIIKIFEQTEVLQYRIDALEKTPAKRRSYKKRKVTSPRKVKKDIDLGV